MNKHLVVDIENDGQDPRKDGRLLCMSYGWVEIRPYDKTQHYITNVEPAHSIPEWVWAKIAEPGYVVISHSIHDPTFLRKMGREVQGPFHNTMVMAHLLNENTNLDLESCVKIYTGQDMDKRISKKENKIWFTTDEGEKLLLAEAWEKFPEQVMHYCLRDTRSTLDLYLNLKGRMEKVGWWDEYLIEHVPMTECLVDMECAGIPLNLEKSNSLRIDLVAQAESQKAKLFDDLGYNLNFNSPKQLRTVLFSDIWSEQLKLPITKGERDWLRGKDSQEEPVFPANFELERVGTMYAYGTILRKGLGINPKIKTESGEWSTSTPVLTVYHGNHPIVSDLIAYRKTNKVITTYLDTYEKYSYEGELYGHFNQTGTTTGRLSHSNPNLGNQPTHGDLGHRVRSLFEGSLIVGDHSQLEPRLMGHFSQDPVLLDIYRTGKDIYLVTGEYIFGKKLTKDDVERQISKTLVLAMGYGAGYHKVAQILAVNGFWTEPDRAKEYLAHLEKLYKVYFDWKLDVDRTAKRLGYVKTIGGRYRRLKWAYGSAAYKIRNKASRQAVNSIIQGSAADILRRNMIECHHLETIYPIQMINQVHDELLWKYFSPQMYSEDTWDVLPKEINTICENPGYDLSIPLVFEAQYCRSWAEKGSGFALPPTDEDIEQEIYA